MLGLTAKDSVEILGFSVNQVIIKGEQTNKNLSGTKPLPGNANEVPFSLSIRGTFANLTAFIKDFENLRTVTKIDSLGIGSSVTDKGVVIVAVISGREPFLSN